ncbi:MAG: hypothetical protein JOZ67_00915 [Gammaproteobacteria bacterium]|nr:hypothetical protein [Gammaproteobacteria bacterium]
MTPSRVRRPPLLVLGLAALALPGLALAARAYVSNEDDGTVSVIDTEALRSLATVSVGKRARGMALSADGARLYVAVTGVPKCPPPLTDEQCAKLKRDRHADGVAVVDTATLKLLRTLPAGSDPERVELARDGRSLFVTDEDAAHVSVVDVARARVVAGFAVGREPEGVRLSPNGAWVLVTSEADNTVTIADAATHRVLHTVLVGTRPRDLAFAPDSSAAFVSGEGDATVYRVALPNGAPAARLLQLPRELKPMGVVFDVPRSRLYVTTGRGATVAVVSPAGDLQQQVPVGGRPWGIALCEGKQLVTANGPVGNATVLDAATLKILGKVETGHGAWGVVCAR